MNVRRRSAGGYDSNITKKQGMKKMINTKHTQSNKRGLAARFASAIVCFALLLLGATAFAAAPANDNFASAQSITGTSTTVSGTTVDATRQSGDPVDVLYPATGNPTRRSTAGDRSVWYKWTAPASGNVTFQTQSKPTPEALDTQLGVYTGTLGSLTEVTSSEDAFDSSTGNENALGGGLSRVSFSAVNGTEYFIMVNGFESVAGAFDLTLTTGGTPPPPPTGLALTVNTTGSGTVTRSPDKATYDTNEVVTLVANPTGTNTFLGWTGTDEASASLTNTVTMSGSKTVTAAFTTSPTPGGGGGKTSINVAVNGLGKVVPNLNGKNNLVIGRTYRLNAIPGKDQVFAGWTGLPSGANADSPRLALVMEEGLSITANFIPNPYNVVVGTYNGLFFNTNAITQNCSGSFNLRVGKTGKFTGRFIKGGATFPVSGQFNTAGEATTRLGRGTNAATAQLQLDMSGASDRVTGTVTSDDCVANVEGDRVVFSARNPSQLKGNYTILLPRNTNNVNAPNANGFATLSISSAGKAKLKGELGDGSKFTQTSDLTKNGQIPVYASLYKKAGSLIGWLTVTEADANGTLSWIKPGTNGFEADIQAIGSAFNATNSPLLTLSNAVIEIGGDGLADSLLVPVTLSNNTFSVTGTNDNDVALKVGKDGSLQGNFTAPGAVRKTAIRGVVLQNSNTAGGYFVGTGSNGFVEVRDQAVVGTAPEPTVP